ncbi:MAG: hypothetical protein RR827_09355, partial [Oscillospiraceae bacterium]
MKNEKSLNSVENIEDRFIDQANDVKKPLYSKFKVWLPIAACVIVAAVAIFGYFMAENKPQRITALPPSSDAPMGMRKVLIYGGGRYVFLEDGGEFKLGNDPFGECLGEITQNLEENPKLYSTQDFSASYAVGGKIYPLPPYDPDFRVAVLHDGKAYICEKVASIDNTPMDLQEYFKSADLLSLTESIDVYDHFGLSLLKTIKGKKAQAILEGVSLCAPAKLKDEDYGAIGAAQTEGKSF